jgi:hypothetical protein
LAFPFSVQAPIGSSPKNRESLLELFNSEKRLGECRSEGFVDSKTWKTKAKLEPIGQQKPRTVKARTRVPTAISGFHHPELQVALHPTPLCDERTTSLGMFPGNPNFGVGVRLVQVPAIGRKEMKR